MAAKTVTTTPKSIRNLQLLSPEGVAAVWADKKKDDTFFAAVTTKAAGWSEFSQRKHLVGPMTAKETTAYLVGLKKRGESARVAFEEYLGSLDAAVQASADAEHDDKAAIINDPMYPVFVERAKGRTPERNSELVVEVAGEIEALKVKITEVTDPEMVAKITFNVHRKEVMIEALRATI